VSLSDFEKNMPSRPLTAKSNVSNMSGFTSQLKFDFSKNNSRMGMDSRTMGQSQSRLGNMHYAPVSRPMTGREPKPTHKSPRGLNNKQFNRCDSARSNLLPRSNLNSAKNLASLDNLFTSVDEPLTKSTSLHNLYTLANEEVNLDTMDANALKKYTTDSQDKMRTVLQEYKHLQDKHDTLEVQYTAARLNWKDDAEYKSME